MKEMNGELVGTNSELLDLFQSEEDRRGTDILKMSNFLDVLMVKTANIVHQTGQWQEANEKIRDFIGMMPSAINLGYAVFGDKILIADMSSLSSEIKKGLASGKYKISPSTKDPGNFRSMIEENGKFIKQITLKQAINRDVVLGNLQMISMQVALKEISDKIESVGRSVQDIKDFQRRETLSTPFINAREMIMNAADKSLNDPDYFLNEADRYLSEGLNSLYGDLNEQRKYLASLKFFNISIERIDEILRCINEDMQMIPRYVGLRMYLFNLRGAKKRAEAVAEDYKCFLEKWSTKKLGNSNYTAFELIHQYEEYTKENMDFWIEQPKNLLAALNSYKEISEQAQEKVFYLEVDEENEIDGKQ